MKILKGKNKILLLVGLVVLVYLIPQLGFAGILESVAKVISSAVLTVVNFLVGWLISLLIKVFVSIAQYNNFIGSAAVSKGWIIMRDLLNMFFVIALLVIAFSTVLGIQKYHYKKLLLGLLIAAVLVNFSKLICGIFIDISQVLMLTFVSAFKNVASGNLIEMMGLKGLLELSNTNQNVGDFTAAGQVVGATLLALIMATVSVVVLGVIVMILIFRIIWLWFLIVLSPFAFVASVFPGQMKGYSSKWWSKFTKQVIVGPVLAFCLWLSFAVVQEGDMSQGVHIDKAAYQTSNGTETEQTITAAASPQYLLNFMLGIGMLVGSLMVAESLGVAGAGIATKAKNNLEKYAKGKKGPLKAPKQVAKGVAKGAGKAALKAPGRLVGGGLKGLGRKMQEKGKKGGVMEKAGKLVKGAGEPTKNIQQLKTNIAKSFRKKGKARRERIAKGEGGIIDKAINAIGEDYKSEGWSERRTMSAAHLERVEDRRKSFEDQGADNNRLKYNLKNGSQIDAEAAASMLAKRDALKDDPETFELARKRIQAGGNKKLNDQFDKNAKKTMDPDTLSDVVYNGFERGAKDFEQMLKDVKAGDLDINKFLDKMSDENFKKMQNAAGDKGALIELFNKQGKEGFQSTVGKLSKTKKGRERYNKMLAKADVSKMEDEKDKDEFINQNSNFIPSMSDENFQKMQDAAGDKALLAKLFENQSRDEFESFAKKMRKTKKGRKRLNEMIDGSDKIKGMDASKLESEEDKMSFIKATGRLDFVVPSAAIEKKYKNKEKEIKESDEFETEEKRDDALKANKKAKEQEIEAIDTKEIDTFVSDHKSTIMNNLSEKAVKSEEVVKTLLRDKTIKRKDIDSLQGKVKKAFLDRLEKDLLPEFNENGDTSDVANKARKMYTKMKNNISKAFKGATGEVQKQLKNMIDNNEIKIDDIAKNKVQDVDAKTIKTLGENFNGKQVIQLAKKNNALAQKIYKARKEQGNLSDAEKNSEWFEDNNEDNNEDNDDETEEGSTILDQYGRKMKRD